ncbi:MAG: hypothetical protein Q4G24_08860 [Paracoccus sp. (in: a-proteobacteria)]|uniref:hypothetical protein n=1 Tax=Paracoccus sp. TaxID=267 RepID=UPI0026E0AC54|nr:hypothetical protein [Paracoccus sp. (in: a-proteobacteria)]MDO5621564.1 hypothetical protein [Paracoccus sp. (in: a-proteobacteria)]
MNFLSILTMQMPRVMMPQPIGLNNNGVQNGGNNLATMLQGLADVFQGLSEMIGGGAARNTNTSNSFTGVMVGSGSTSNAGLVSSDAAPIAGKARIWGDPHFIGADGGKFDVQGQAGKTYNLLSDKGFQMNGRFDQWRNDPKQTVVGEVGITAGSNYINVSKTGKAVVNGQELKDGQRVQLRDGGYAEKRGKDVIVKKGEWEVNFQTKGDHINMDIKTDNAIADGVRPHGLIGQTFDGDGKARNGDSFAGAQGGGAIEDIHGNIVARGDKTAITSYEVDALWDTTFRHHNRDYAGQSAYADASRNTMQMLMMTSFSTLANSLFSNQNQWGWGNSSYRF